MWPTQAIPSRAARATAACRSGPIGNTTSAWTLDYTLTAASFISPTTATTASHGRNRPGPQSPASVNANGTVSLFGTSYTAGDADSDGLYGFVDTLTNTTSTQVAGQSLIELATSATDSDFKGVVFVPAAVPEPMSWTLGGIALAGFAFLRRRMMRGQQ